MDVCVRQHGLERNLVPLLLLVHGQRAAVPDIEVHVFAARPDNLEVASTDLADRTHAEEVGDDQPVAGIDVQVHAS